MVNTIKTIINGIKCWITDSINSIKKNVDSIKENVDLLYNRVQTLESKPDFKQVQGDWSQNDETAVDYVKNRPGGYYDEFKNVNIFTITYIMTSGTNNQNVTTPTQRIDTSYDSITVHEDYSGTYQVLRKRYVPEYIVAEGSAYGYGNSSLCGYGDDTGEKYFIVYADNKTHVYCKPDDNIIGRIITLNGYVDMNVPHTFDSSFLPIANSRIAGCCKAKDTGGDDDDSSLRQYSEVFVTKSGKLYSGKTLPGVGINGQVPVFKDSNYTLQNFGILGGGEQNLSHFDYYVSDSTTDVVFVLNSKTVTERYTLAFYKLGGSTGYITLYDTNINFDSANGSMVIHVNRILKDYISYRIYSGNPMQIQSERNFVECKELSVVRLDIFGEPTTKFIAEMYGN